EGGLPLGSPIADGAKVQAYRQVTLNPTFASGECHFHLPTTDPIVELLLNNSKWNGLREGATAPISGSQQVDDTWQTEFPQVGSTEVWDLIDLSNDDHPIHLHLVQFQVIARIPFDFDGY